MRKATKGSTPKCRTNTPSHTASICQKRVGALAGTDSTASPHAHSGTCPCTDARPQLHPHRAEQRPAMVARHTRLPRPSTGPDPSPLQLPVTHLSHLPATHLSHLTGSGSSAGPALLPLPAVLLPCAVPLLLPSDGASQSALGLRAVGLAGRAPGGAATSHSLQHDARRKRGMCAKGARDLVHEHRREGEHLVCPHASLCTSLRARVCVCICMYVCARARRCLWACTLLYFCKTSNICALDAPYSAALQGSAHSLPARERTQTQPISTHAITCAHTHTLPPAAQPA